MSKILQIAKETLQIEAESILGLIPKLNGEFERAVHEILNCKGKVILTGIGKSGQVARKISSTLSSTGTPSIFLHPAESSHGDLGVISKNDLVIALSYGGETAELGSLLNFISRNGVSLIALTGKSGSTLAQTANIVLDVSVEKEACPLRLAPTSSSTATLAMGDALAMAVLESRGFKSENFAELHPSGSLGAKLMRVKDIMQTGDALPFVTKDTSMKALLTTMTHQSVRGAAGVLDHDGQLIGVITDGDIRRFLEKNQDPFSSTAANLMSHSPKTIDASELAERALFLMEQFRTQMLIVLDKNSAAPLKPVGMIIYQDLLRAKIR
ncbi:KpsF/GutQ family sugar-phosphate isomerase [Pseudobdellovibrio exovorus]|uniref:Polysialic acid capsule expression protein n=1 Tax=Pseudobdellovibrio exovorus JSS TaxID=1184267 RepID=M4V6W8_9BACT|nr:KpsF/GutQ family sugar-phosphate isomerase [Pseudobdellovibrio exovorus]AGH94943.1 polysialic acid capsule expression protein [Pseudobdellovibrio exovorus JSS]